MDNLTFNTEKRKLNREYYELFGEVPCMQNFSCSREKYILALKEAIQTNKRIETLLPKAGAPLNKDVLT